MKVGDLVRYRDIHPGCEVSAGVVVAKPYARRCNMVSDETFIATQVIWCVGNAPSALALELTVVEAKSLEVISENR
tara:strand:+ start:186 stop:413 length:228 start_codon:yes stop_codon:yes gene_type:complete